jgi:NADPH:quinone reductase-like Zn-dependent oxidoreductase
MGYASVEAWVIRPAESAGSGSAEMERRTIELRGLSDGEVLAAPLYGCWEGNMGHAVARDPIDVCRARGEDYVVLGNAATVRVLETGPGVSELREGDRAILICNGDVDRYGFPSSILGYDCPGSVGCLSKRMVLKERQLVKLPPDTRYSMAQWAAFSLRYVTAWANWQLAYGVLRLQVPAELLPVPHVCGWGGGVSLAELDLAARVGCRALMLSSRAEQLRTSCGDRLEIIDRNTFPDLHFDPKRFDADREYREAYRRSEELFLRELDAYTGGEGINIFLDYIGEPVHRATLKALARNGVIATAGWKHGMHLRILRAKECIERHQHVHTHYANRAQALEAVRFAESNEWMPSVDPRLYAFDEIPELARDYAAGGLGYFPCFAVNPE